MALRNAEMTSAGVSERPRRREAGGEAGGHQAVQDHLGRSRQCIAHLYPQCKERKCKDFRQGSSQLDLRWGTSPSAACRVEKALAGARTWATCSNQG